MAQPQPTDVLIKRLQRVAKWLDGQVDPQDGLPRVPNPPEQQAMRARANTCWQAAGRLEQFVRENPSDLDALLEHHRATERENGHLRRRVEALEAAMNPQDAAEAK